MSFRRLKNVAFANLEYILHTCLENILSSTTKHISENCLEDIL